MFGRNMSFIVPCYVSHISVVFKCWYLALVSIYFVPKVEIKNGMLYHVRALCKQPGACQQSSMVSKSVPSDIRIYSYDGQM